MQLTVNKVLKLINVLLTISEQFKTVTSYTIAANFL